MYVLNHTPDTAMLLAKLTAIIGEHLDPVDRYLQQRGEDEMIWKKLGIQYLITNIHHGKTASQGQWNTATEHDPYKWGHMRKDTSMEELTKYLSGCSIIQFAEFVSVPEATDLWDGLFADVIKKGIDKRTIEFIFQMGNVTGRTVFEVDEVLDVIGQYSKHGRVSLVMEEQEADALWDLLCGINYEPSAKEKYQLQFSTMRIDTLLILYNNGVLLYTKEGLTDFTSHTYPPNREYFLTGYRLGLLLHLTIPHAIVLGQAVSGACQVSGSLPTTRNLLNYLNDWGATITNI